jgi:hypothetical protein
MDCQTTGSRPAPMDGRARGRQRSVALGDRQGDAEIVFGRATPGMFLRRPPIHAETYWQQCLARRYAGLRPAGVPNLVVPAEGIEPPTFGLQNRCSTAELSRHSPLLALPHHQITSPKRPQRDIADVPSDACKRAQVALPRRTAQRLAAAAAQAIALSLDWQSKK